MIEIRAAQEAKEADLSPSREQPVLPKPSEPLQATFVCDECQQPAATVVFLPAYGRHPGPWSADAPPGVETIGQDQPRLAIQGGPAPVTLSLFSKPLAVLAAMAIKNQDAAALFSLDSESAPFWCPTCGASYCAAHWIALPTFDDGFFDCIVGFCVHGHRRTLLD